MESEVGILQEDRKYLICRFVFSMDVSKYFRINEYVDEKEETDDYEISYE